VLERPHRVMPIIYSLVARTTTILAKYAECVGNFAEVTEQILPKIQTDVNNKLTYSHGNYLIHYVCENKVIYMCITDDVSMGQKRRERICTNYKFPEFRKTTSILVPQRDQKAIYHHVWPANRHRHSVCDEYGIFAGVGARDATL
jgi:Regulated-SNARE-like domain